MRDGETVCFQERYQNGSCTRRNRLPADQHRITTTVLLSRIEGFTTDHDVGCFALFRIPYNIEYIQVFLLHVLPHGDAGASRWGAVYTDWSGLPFTALI